MLPARTKVTQHSILGSVAEYYHQQALEEGGTQSEEIALKLPPVFNANGRQRNPEQSESRENDSLDHSHTFATSVKTTPTIPSIFSPRSTHSNARKRNQHDLIRGQQIEKQKEHRKLQQLLKGDRIYATREERVLRRWNKQQKQWQNMKRNIAQKVGKSTNDLVITRAEEWREMVEEIDLMAKSVPCAAMSSSHWQHTLRKKTGMEESTQLVPVGNMFSGLYCKVTQNPRKPIKETVRKPRKLSLPITTEPTEYNLFFNHYNLPGKGAASKHWRERSATYEFRKKLHRRMVQLKPNNLDELDGLEIVGYNMFSLEHIPLPSYSYERLMETQSVSKSTEFKTRDYKGSSSLDDVYECKDMLHDEEAYNVVEPEQEQVVGPAVQFLPGDMITFDTVLYQEQTRLLEIKNVGTTAMLMRFDNVEQEFVTCYLRIFVVNWY